MIVIVWRDGFTAKRDNVDSPAVAFDMDSPSDAEERCHSADRLDRGEGL